MIIAVILLAAGLFLIASGFTVALRELSWCKRMNKWELERAEYLVPIINEVPTVSLSLHHEALRRYTGAPGGMNLTTYASMVDLVLDQENIRAISARQYA